MCGRPADVPSRRRCQERCRPNCADGERDWQGWESASPHSGRDGICSPPEALIEPCSRLARRRRGSDEVSRAKMQMLTANRTACPSRNIG